ncbi:universal stress protein [Frankia sp. AgKG'84/4]|uniref:universal stress protein n=1 Tax=Frankia sp. AgKG'84/4 TaxID=573490 RepID=UPI00202A0475|nr:universal stress protein [Frankia sp. AgKG'84/4]MCL9796537.1 universal stress protein [Frankia sp. AgKG'84/4]
MLVEDYGPEWAPGRFELGTDGARAILVGVDGSRTSLRAAAFAAGLARRQSSWLVLVYVAATPVWAAMSPAPTGNAVQLIIDGVVDDVRGLIQDRQVELGVPIRFLVRAGDPFDGIRRTAAEVRADLVAVGASESAGHRLIGSLAGRLVRAGQWPVIVVP